MNSPRRRVLRPAAPTSSSARQDRLQARRRDQLVRERESLGRWMGKLKRAFHAVERLQGRIARLERQLAAS